MLNLPMELINLIMSYMSSSTALIIKNTVNEINKEYYYDYPDNNFSFAAFYFNKQYEIKNNCEVIYNYSHMFEEYFYTINGYGSNDIH